MHGLGTTYEIMNTNIKRWSVGSPIQAPLDSLLDLIRAHGIKAGDVEKLTVRVANQGANTTDNRDMPDICMQHMCAVMLIDGIVTFESAHDEKRMKDPKVLALRSRIELFGDEALTRAPALAPGHRRAEAEGRARTAAPHQGGARHGAEPDDAGGGGREGLPPDGADPGQSAGTHAVRCRMGPGQAVQHAEIAAAAPGLTAVPSSRFKVQCWFARTIWFQTVNFELGTWNLELGTLNLERDSG